MGSVLRSLATFVFRLSVMVVITAALLEGGLRVYERIDPSFFFPSSSYDRFRGRPHAPDWDFHLNSRGFKDVEFAARKAPGSFRIASVGDSFVFGVVPYRHHFLTLLEEKLRMDGREIEILNMGIPGMGVEDYLALLVNEALPARPDLVVCFFFTGNDFIEWPKKPGIESYLLTFLRNAWRVWRGYEGQQIHAAGDYDDSGTSLDQDRFIAIEKARSWIYHRRWPHLRTNLARAVAGLVRMREAAASRGAGFLVVVIPDEVQVNPELQDAVRFAYGADGVWLDFERPNRKLAEALGAADIPVIDLLEDFVAASREQRLYKPQDTHWNIAGNALAAEVLVRHLDEGGKWLPALVP